MFLTISRCLHKVQQNRYRFMFLILLFISVLSLLLNIKKQDDVRKCFTHSNKPSELFKFEDILLSSRKPKPGKSIFFHETSCSNNPENIINLSARQACAIESAALTNPQFDVFVIFASPTYFKNESSQPLIDAILSYPNVYIRNLDLWTYAADTPIDDWFKNGELFSSKYVLSHISDFLRYLSLWRWGGTYLDLDVIVKKNLENVPSNYAGAESSTFIAAGVMNFDAKGFGHEIAELCLRDFQMHFNGNDWGNNGPGVITRVLKQVCKTQSPLVMTRDRCFGFHVYPKEAFYAVDWRNWNHFFEESHKESTLRKTKDSYVIHVWNMHSKNRLVKVGSNVAYGKIAEQFCPKVYSCSGEFF